MRLKRSPAACNLREMIDRWKIWNAYCKHQKAHKKRCRARKKQYLHDKMKEAQRASATMDLRGVYQVVRCLAPKAECTPVRRRLRYFVSTSAPNSRPRMIGLINRLSTIKLRPMLEGRLALMLLNCHNSSWLPPYARLYLRDTHLVRYGVCVLTSQPPLEHVINSGWLEGIRIPQGWSDAYLVLIRKPGKSGKEPGHHRPIGLQDQVGKLVFRHVVPHIHHQACIFSPNMAISLAEASMPYAESLNTVQWETHVVVKGTRS